MKNKTFFLILFLMVSAASADNSELKKFAMNLCRFATDTGKSQIGCTEKLNRDLDKLNYYSVALAVCKDYTREFKATNFCFLEAANKQPDKKIKLEAHQCDVNDPTCLSELFTRMDGQLKSGTNVATQPQPASPQTREPASIHRAE